MWIFAKQGFVSIVENVHTIPAECDPNCEDPECPYIHQEVSEPDKANLLVRSRFKGDLQHLFPGCHVRTTPDRDYRFRTVLPRKQVAKRIAELVANIDYGNFKDSTPRNRHDTYLDVWSTLWLEQRRRYNRGQPLSALGKAAMQQEQSKGYDGFMDWVP